MLVFVALGCGNSGDPTSFPQPEVVDADDDGFDARVDCDDDDPAVNPDANDVCNGLDDDCDGLVDGPLPWLDGATARIPFTVTDALAGDIVEVPTPIADQDVTVVLHTCTDEIAVDAQWAAGFFDAERGTVFVMPDDVDAISGAVYLGAGGGANAVSTSKEELDNGLVVATFDPDAGGLLDTLSLDGSGNLASQAQSKFGNALSTDIGADAWRIDPQDGPGTLEVLARGPVGGAVRASGARWDLQAGYAYEIDYWLLADQPQLYVHVREWTVLDSVLEHLGDATDGIRPWQAIHPALGVNDEQDVQIASNDMRIDLYDDVEEVGVAIGFVRAPLYRTNHFADAPSSIEPISALMANDFADVGGGTPQVIPEGTAFVDHAIFVVMPHDRPWSEVQADFTQLLDPAVAWAFPMEER